MTGRIFVSYRRTDSQYATDHIYEQLVKHFGDGRVFMDIDAIPLGVNFRDYIDQQISTSEIVLAIIGDHWLNAVNEKGELRLHNPHDFVRLEIEAALKQGIKLIPIYIGNVQNIPAKKLPKSLADLPLLNATQIRRGNDFYSDVNKLIRGLEQILQEQAERREENISALTGLKDKVGEITNRLTGIEASLIQEMRKRTQLERDAQHLSEQITDLLKDPGKQLRADPLTFRDQIDSLQDSLMELLMQVEARKQGRPVEPYPEPQQILQENLSTAESFLSGKQKRLPGKVKSIEHASSGASGQPFQLRKIPLWGWGAGFVVVLLVIAGFIFIPSLFGNQSNNQIEQTREPTADAQTQTKTSPNTSTAYTISDTGAQDEPDFIAWTKAISESTPDYIEDFSIPTSAWRGEFIKGLPLENFVSPDGQLVIKDAPPERQDYLWYSGYSWNFQLQFDLSITELAIDSKIEVFFMESQEQYNFFHLEKNGRWSITTVSSKNEQEQILDSGEIDSLEEGQVYSIQITDYNGKIAILINGELLSYVLDSSEVSEGFIRLLIETSQPIDVTFDNILIWDLTDTPYLENPPIHQTSSFLHPIRQYLSDTIPDFEDDFETYEPYWDQMQISFSDTKQVNLANLIQEGEIILNSTDDLEYTGFSFSFPNLYAQDYAVQYDFFFDDPIPSRYTNSVNTDWGSEDDPQHFSAFCDFYQSGYLTSCGLYRYDDKGRFDQPLVGPAREIYDVFQHHSTFLVISYDGQFAIFLDGFLMGYIEDLEQVEQQLILSFGSGENFRVRIDNIRFWKLDGSDIFSRTGEQTKADFDFL